MSLILLLFVGWIAWRVVRRLTGPLGPLAALLAVPLGLTVAAITLGLLDWKRTAGR